MTAKTYLKQAYRLDDLIKANQIELERLRGLSTSIRGVDYSKEKVQTSSVSNDAGFVNAVCKIVELEKQINDDIVNMINLKLRIRNDIENVVDRNEKLVLKLIYVNFMNFETIAEELNYSVSQVSRIHKRALNNFKAHKTMCC